MTAIDPQHSAARRQQSTGDDRLRSREVTLRCAVVGAGKMGQHHARALRRVDAVQVVAIADPSPDAHAAVHRLWPDAARFDALEGLLQSAEIDVVHICTAPATHERLATLALEAGCHVYVEKPVAESVAQVERLVALADARGRVLCAGHQLLFEPPMRRMLELLPALGDLVHLESFFSFRPVRRAPGGRGALASDLQLLDVLPHPVYLLLQLLERGDPGATPELAGLEVGRAGTVHAIVRCGALSGTLVVTLAGRPVESYLRAVGTNGTLHADFVRGTVQHLIGPGTSGIDKALNPFRQARQLLVGTSGALGSRALKRQRSYPGLVEIFQAFHASIRSGGASPVSAASIVETVRVCEQIAGRLRRCGPQVPVVGPSPEAPGALVTGGNGFLGRFVVEALAAGGTPVRAVGRRPPAPWDREPAAEYAAVDLGDMPPRELFEGIDLVVHCAAETAGGWDAHRRNSIDVTERMLRAASAAGVRRFIHVSSLATLAGAGREPIRDDGPLEPRAMERGPYVWGKAESERLAERLGAELGVEVRIVRPGALVDYGRFDPPGKLGRRIGNIFVAVGAPSDPLGVVDVRFAARTIAWLAAHFDAAPRVLNLLSPVLPTRRELIARLRRSNPDLMVVRLPGLVLVPLSWAAIAAQKILRPGRPAVDVAKVFASQRYDTSRIAELAPAILDRHDAGRPC